MKKKRGRPPIKFEKRYCDMLIEHMRQGLSFESFAGVVVVAKQTLYTWLEKNPSFLDAKKKGEGLSRLWWEKIGTAGMMAQMQSKDGKTIPLKNFNSGIWVFSMKNRFGWKDRVQLSQDDDDGGFEFTE